MAGNGLNVQSGSDIFFTFDATVRVAGIIKT
jgi:hypothetical protein